MSKLTLQYQYDSSFFDPKRTQDDFGRLSVTVETDRFSGKGGFWVQWQDVKEFGEALGAYPIRWIIQLSPNGVSTWRKATT